MTQNYPINGKKILITGGLGFIGAFLVRELVHYNNECFVIDSQNPVGSTADALQLLDLDNIHIIQENLLEDKVYQNLPVDFDYIIHAAGILGIKRVSEFPLLTADVNVFATRKILDFSCRQKRLTKFIHFSSSEVYGKKALQVNENDPSIIPNIGTRWIYASSKHFSEYLLKAFVWERGINGVIVRPFNVYGPYRMGSNAMTSIIKKAIMDEEIKITGNGKQSRCWCYIDDFIDGVIRCLDNKTISGQAFNIGNPSEPISMYELALSICRKTNSNSKIHILHDIDDDVMIRSPDISQARDLLGFEPRVTLDEGVQQVVNWLSSSLIKV